MPTATDAPTDLDAALARAISDYLAFSRSAHLHADAASWERRGAELWDEMMTLRARVAELGEDDDPPDA